MSHLDVKWLLIDPERQNTPRDIAGNYVFPPNSRNVLTVTFPKNKINKKAFTAIKLIAHSSTAFTNDYILIDYYSNGFMRLLGKNPAGEIVDCNIMFNRVDYGFPAANPSNPWFGGAPDPITDMNDFALMLQNVLNVSVNFAFYHDVFGTPNPFVVTWIPVDTSVGSSGHLIFTNIKAKVFALDFTTYLQNMAQLLGFGYVTTDFLVEHISNTTMPDFGTYDPVIDRSSILLSSTYMMGGIDSGVILLNGSITSKNILSALYLAIPSPYSTIIREVPTIGYSIIKNSSLYDRMRYLVYGPWIDNPMPNLPDIQMYDPYFRISFMFDTGISLETVMGGFSRSDANVFKFEILFNEADSIGNIDEYTDTYSGTMRIT
jgi:hypothetical protein